MKFFVLESPIRWLFLAHALVGALALGVLIIPLLSKKGGRVHIQVGWIYTYAMILVGLSAMVITPWRALVDPHRTRNSQSFALFLFFIAAFTLSNLNCGISALKQKKRQAPSRSLYQVGPPLIVVGLGMITLAIGIHRRDTLLTVFPIFGFISANDQLSYWLTQPKKKMHWWYAHMDGMFGACIATITAFLVTALPRFWPNPIANSPALWIAPGVILGVVLNRWKARYQLQFKD